MYFLVDITDIKGISRILLLLYDSVHVSHSLFEFIRALLYSSTVYFYIFTNCINSQARSPHRSMEMSELSFRKEQFLELLVS